jgi:predicted phage terminase large subunit-like protein
MGNAEPLQQVKRNVTPNLFSSIILAETSKSLVATEMPFRDFVREAWKVLEPANLLSWNWHIDLIAEYLQLVAEGRIKKLNLNLPPRNLKSNIVTILWPVWTWTLKPWLRWIFCSYSGSLSTKHSIDRRRVMDSPWFKSNWGNILQFTEDQNQKAEYENTARGYMISTSVGGTLTGKGGDGIVTDDMINPFEAESEAARNHAHSMWKNVLATRLDNPKTGFKVNVEQRTHEKDITGVIIKDEKGWVNVCLPLVAEKKTIIDFPVSGRQLVRETGELLHPSRQGEVEVLDLKTTMGTRAYMAQCQQNPTDDQTSLVKRNWWKFWDRRPEGADITIQSWDFAFKETKKGSYVVGQVWKKRGAQKFLMDQIRARMDFPEMLTSMLNLSLKWPEATLKLVEDAANGPAIIATLQTKISGIIPVKPLGSKRSRASAQAVAPQIEAGNVYLPGNEPWVNDFVEEWAAFKGIDGEINDQVDATSQALLRLYALDFVESDESGGGESSLLEELGGADPLGGRFG